MSAPKTTHAVKMEKLAQNAEQKTGQENTPNPDPDDLNKAEENPNEGNETNKRPEETEPESEDSASDSGEVNTPYPKED